MERDLWHEMDQNSKQLTGTSLALLSRLRKTIERVMRSYLQIPVKILFLLTKQGFQNL